MGYILVYTVVRANLKKQVFAEISKLPDQNYISVVLPRSDKSRLMKGRKFPEIKLNGQMFDVVKTINHGNFTTYLCIRDFKEEQFVRQANQFIMHGQRENPLQKTTSLIIDNIIKTALLYSTSKIKEVSESIKHYISESHIYNAPLLNISVPPPQFFT